MIIFPLPISQDLTISVLEADSKRTLKSGWVVYEYNGCEIYKIVDGMENLSSEQLFYAKFYPLNDAGEPIFHKPITNKDDLKVGDAVMVWDGYGYIKMDEDGDLYVDCLSYYGILEFDADERHCWVCSCVVNKNIKGLIFKC